MLNHRLNASSSVHYLTGFNFLKLIGISYTIKTESGPYGIRSI